MPPVTVSIVNIALLTLALAGVSAAPRKPKNKELKNVIITSFGEMPYEPVEGFYQGDAIPVGVEGDEKNPTMDVVLRTGILVEDPNEKKSEEENSAEDEDEDALDKSSKDNKKKTGEELFREFREKYRYAPKKDQKSRSASNGWSPVLPSFADDFLQPRKKPSETPRDNGSGYNIDREYQGDIGAGWNQQDAEEVLQNRNYNILSQNPSGYPTIPPREVPPPLLTPGVQYPFAVPSLPLPYPDFNLQRRSRVFPFDYAPSFYGHPEFAKRPNEFTPIDRQDAPKKLEVGRVQLHPTRIGVPYNPAPAVFFGPDYFSGV